MLTKKERVTIQELADKFEVSKRTIFRDLDTLNIAGIPIVSYHGTRGGISVIEGYKIDKNILSEEDVKNLYIGLNGLKSIGNSDSISHLLSRLMPKDESLIFAESDIIIDLSSWFEDSNTQKKVTMFHNAILNRQCVKIEYLSINSQTARIVEPHKLIFKQSYWYLYAFCLVKKEFRLFKLSRIVCCEILERKFDYKPNHEINLKVDFGQSSSITATPQYPIEVLLEFDNLDKYYIVDKIGSKYLQSDNNGITNIGVIHFYTSRIDWIIDLVISLQGKVRVIQPIALQNEVKEKLKKMLSVYNGDI